MKTGFILALAAAIAAAPATAQQHEPGHQPPPGHPSHEAHFGQHLFPPELIMQHHRNIGLTVEQRTTVTKAIQDLQARVLDLQWKMEEESGKIGDLLKAPTVEETTVLAQVDKVLGIEREVKRAHLAMLIRIKNALRADQQAKLMAVRNAAVDQPSPR